MNILPWNAGQWVNCHGSVLMQTLYPAQHDADGEESQDAKEGKAFHHIIAEMLKSRQDIDARTILASDVLGTITPHGIVVDEQMAQAAMDYVTNIMTYIGQNGTLNKMHIEERIDLSQILGDGRYGIPDIWVWDKTRGELFITDAKYGHRIVDVFENWQLIVYVIAILDMLNIDGFDEQHITVRMRIYQPRAPHVDGASRDWVVKAADLRAHRNQINDAVATINSATSHCKAGSWCRAYHCSAAHACESLQRTVYNYLDYVGDAIPFELDEHNIAAEYLILKTASDLLKTRLSAIEEQSIGMIRNGTNISGLTTQQGYGREKWRKNVPTDEVILMGDLMEVDVRKPIELDTPAVCRKKGIDDSVIKAYSETPKTKLQLVIDDGSKARRIFK